VRIARSAYFVQVSPQTLGRERAAAARACQGYYCRWTDCLWDRNRFAFGIGLFSLSQFAVAGFAVAQFALAHSLIAQFGFYSHHGQGQFVKGLNDFFRLFA
ncbi:MAG: hypothetical protein DMG71_01360, partial [Acidobacteria bacterium]